MYTCLLHVIVAEAHLRQVEDADTIVFAQLSACSYVC